MIIFKALRNGSGPIVDRIKAGVAWYFEEYGCLPAICIVSKKELAEAKKAVEALDLVLEVRGNGGCNALEVWLEEPKKEGQIESGQLKLEGV